MGIKIAIIDGTGPAKGYDAAFKLSFCHALKDRMQQDADYQRGPTAAGLQTYGEADPSTKLMTAGYSRGGSAVIVAAEMLRGDGIKVDAPFLFDPVARHFTRGERPCLTTSPSPASSSATRAGASCSSTRARSATAWASPPTRRAPRSGTPG